MTVTLTYDATLSRVRVTADGLGLAETALVEKSTDGVRWSTVRGGMAVEVTAGSMVAPVDDYEFADETLTTYRVRGMRDNAISYVAAGAGTSGDNASLTPATPAGIAIGDLKVILASIRNSGTGVVNTPAGWVQLVTYGNVSLLGRIHETGDADPTVTFTGGAAGDTTLARMAAWRDADLVGLSHAEQLNGSAQNVAYPTFGAQALAEAVIVWAWKQDDFTSVATLATMTEVGENSSTTGNDASSVWDYLLTPGGSAEVATGSFVVTGGASAISRGGVLALQHQAYLNSQTNTITPSLAGLIWMKNIARPFLNRTVNVSDWSPVNREARAGIFPVIGSSAPVAVNDVRGSKVFDLTVRFATVGESDEFNAAMTAGDVWLLHSPEGCPVPGGYVSVGGTTETRNRPRGSARIWTLPLTTVRAPAADVVGATCTWQTILNTYATWRDLLDDNATWLDVLELIGEVEDVITP